MHRSVFDSKIEVQHLKSIFKRGLDKASCTWFRQAMIIISGMAAEAEAGGNRVIKVPFK